MAKEASVPLAPTDALVRRAGAVIRAVFRNATLAEDAPGRIYGQVGRG